MPLPNKFIKVFYKIRYLTSEKHLADWIGWTPITVEGRNLDIVEEKWAKDLYANTVQAYPAMKFKLLKHTVTEEVDEIESNV